MSDRLAIIDNFRHKCGFRPYVKNIHSGGRAFWRARAIGLYTKYYSTLIVRGIGYRILYFPDNDIAAGFNQMRDNLGEFRPLAGGPRAAQGYGKTKQAIEFELEHVLYRTQPNKLCFALFNDLIGPRMLHLSMGHAYDEYLPLPGDFGLKQRKRGRKLIFGGQDLVALKDWTEGIFRYRRPSVYTGRGVRKKRAYVRRKLGKRDARRNRIFF
jgi:hypothetical protein